MGKTWIAVAAACLLIGVGCSSTKYRLKMGDMHESLANLTGLEGDPLEKEPVEFEETGKPKYDEFLRSAAHIRAGLIVSNALVEALTTNVKSFARSYAASRVADENVKELIGETPAEEMTEDQALAVLKLQKKRGELNDDVLEFATRSAANAGQTVLYLTETASSAVTLAKTGGELSQSVQNDFTGIDVAKAPAVAEGITTAVGNLKDAGEEAPELAKRLARLGEGLKSLL
jgi:hypothetical protein